ncbi:hypothetical protein SESBI_50335 [Sesbania bispinosa]|nr:hypothetical protein SESBI_50335 [Sesbania bispinosa]
MAEQQKKSSPANSKEKSSLLDDEIGKEFLSSWKSMSMANDDAMDFSFDTVSKSKKKTFDFEKLDMNFNLDGEFDKISSFKVDMSDLDFTCPPKKSSQIKDKKGEASGTKAGKQDGFNFSFDFNELDSFNLDSSLLKVDTTSNSVNASNDNITMKPRASERQETSKVETSVGNLGNLVSIHEVSVPNFSSSGNLNMPIENLTSDISKTINTEEMDQERDLSEKTKSTESKPEQVINLAPSHPVRQSDSEQDTISEQHREVFSSGTRVINVSGDKQEVTDKAAQRDSDGVDLQLEHSSPPHSTKSDGGVREAIILGSSTEGVTNDPQPEKSYTSCENINKTDVLKKNSCNSDIREDKKSTLECHLVTASSKPVVDKIMLMKDKELQVVQSNMFSMPEDKRSLKHPSSTSGTKSVSFGSKKNADITTSITQARENLRSNDTRSASKIVSDSLPGSGKLMRDAPELFGRKDDLKSCSNTGEGIVFDVSPSAGKLAGNMESFREEVNKSKAIFLETVMSTKDVNILSSQVNPCYLTEKTARITTQISAFSQPEDSDKESLQKSRITSIEGNKLSSFKACKITPALSSLKISRNIGAKTVLATSLHQKEANSLVISEQSKEMQGITAIKNDHLTDSGDNKKSSTPFLKRKTIEVSEADLTSLRSLKRLSQSPSKSRNSKESSEVVKQVESKPNKFLNYHSKSGLESPSEIKVTEVEISDSVLMEDNSNVGKAEAYMKELEDLLIETFENSFIEFSKLCGLIARKHATW